MGLQEGRRPQTDKLLPQSPFKGHFCLDNDIWHCLLLSYQSNLSTADSNLKIQFFLLLSHCHREAKKE